MTMKPWAAWLDFHNMAWVLYVICAMAVAAYLLCVAATAIEEWRSAAEERRKLAEYIRSVKSSKP